MMYTEIESGDEVMDKKAYLYSENGDDLTPKTEGSVGIDLVCDSIEPQYGYPKDSITVLDGCRPVTIGTGVYAAAPKGYYYMVTLRSSLGEEGLCIPNSPGIIDSDYRGEVMVSLSCICAIGTTIKKGDRIAQLILVKSPEEVEVGVVTDYNSFMEGAGETSRGSKGFGSTGK